MTLCACDGIGRHARFRFSCSNACGFESLQAYQKKESEPALNGARFGFFHHSVQMAHQLKEWLLSRLGCHLGKVVSLGVSGRFTVQLVF